ncbi:MAG TPA: SDR family NAD(P)-dependent oxidoreductase [Gaiellaceae bacterium]|nr:SDR family NAD(P)-dependent oxidoreductase [Gaiellaceae bacterium]
MRALVTGGRGGIGSAIVAALRGEGAEATVLDLPEFDVGDSAAWRALDGPYDAAFLNAGIGIGQPDAGLVTDEEYRRILAANVDGVVFGTRELAARLMPDGGSIVATASLAGLVAAPFDPLYGLTKHAVVGFVRSAAPALATRGIRLNALCPGFTDTPIVEAELRGSLPVPLMEPSFVAGAALRVLKDAESGRCWIVQPNRIEPFRDPGVPGPR